jgi:hypothetical protein
MPLFLLEEPISSQVSPSPSYCWTSHLVAPSSSSVPVGSRCPSRTFLPQHLLGRGVDQNFQPSKRQDEIQIRDYYSDDEAAAAAAAATGSSSIIAAGHWALIDCWEHPQQQELWKEDDHYPPTIMCHNRNSPFVLSLVLQKHQTTTERSSNRKKSLSNTLILMVALVRNSVLA